MNKHQVKGLANQATGEIKQQIGKATGDESLRARGQARELKGKAQEKMGNAKEVLREDSRESRARRERELRRDHKL